MKRDHVGWRTRGDYTGRGWTTDQFYIQQTASRSGHPVCERLFSPIGRNDAASTAQLA